jgi:integrase
MDTDNLSDEDKLKHLQLELASLKKKLGKPTRTPLSLSQSQHNDVMAGTRKNGTLYSVRNNRDRFFYPHEWMNFYDVGLRDNQKMTFDFLINTGARINEAINVKVEDIDIPNKRLILRVTKIKAAKKEKTSRPRPISISSQFARKLNKYIKDKKLQGSDYLGLLTASAANTAMKNALQRANIKDWYMFSLHNIRKTHGNWLKSLGIEIGEICSRLGHDHNTFLKSYVSSDIFTYKDKQDMRLVIGDLYSGRS